MEVLGNIVVDNCAIVYIICIQGFSGPDCSDGVLFSRPTTTIDI